MFALVLDTSPPAVAQTQPQLSNCRLVSGSLVGTFAAIPQGNVLVRFRGKKAAWQQWVLLPPDAQQFTSGTGQDVDTHFLGSSDLESPVTCTATSVPADSVFDLRGAGCAQHNVVVDNGAQVDVREIYYDGAILRAVFRVIEQKWLAAGIALLNERLVLVVDGKVRQVVPVTGYEPQVVEAEAGLPDRGAHLIVFGLLEGGVEVPQGSICV